MYSRIIQLINTIFYVCINTMKLITLYINIRLKINLIRPHVHCAILYTIQVTQHLMIFTFSSAQQISFDRTRLFKINVLW